MGISFSCPGSEYDALDLGFEKSTERSVSFNGEDINSIIHSLSFTERVDPPILYSPGSKKMFTDECLSFKGMKADPPNLCSPGSRKMIIEGSFSFKGLKAEQFEVHTTFSVSNSNIKKEDSMSTDSFNVSEVHKSQKVITDHCISHTGSLEGKDAVTTLSVENLFVEKEDTTGTGSFTCSKSNSHEETPTFSLSDPSSPKHEAALKLQKVYKSFRTRRQLADCAILVEQSWWTVLDFALLKHSSYFDVDKPESVISRWSRARIRAAKVGKGLLKNVKAQKLARQHWLEAIDPRHRYGHNLHLYYVHWLKCESKQPFFYWLDVGEGKEVNFEHCPRLRLQQQYIKYLGPKEREAYEVIVEDGKFVYKQNRQFLDTSSGDVDSKWIFVLSTSKILYVGQKKKGKFQHSSFLAGGATSSAGRLVVEQGILKAIWPHSGHYRPTEENFQEFINFLKENNVDLTDIKRSPEEDDEWSSQSKRITSFGSNSSRISVLKTINNYTVETPDLHQDHVSESWLDSSLKEKVKCLNSFSEYEASDDKTPEKTCAHDLIREVNEENNQDSPDNTNIREVNEENNQDSPDNTKKGRTLAEMTDVMGVFEEPNYTNSLSRTRTDSNEELESTSSDFLFHKNNLFTEEKEPSIPQELILLRINSNKGLNFPQLGKQLSFKWTTGAGPCISCVRDYPSELQFQALEKVNLSPRIRIF